MNGEKPGWGFAAGTFGELVQGEIDGVPFLITLPIRWGTRVTFVGSDEAQGLTVWPAHRKKSLRAAEIALEMWKKPISGALVVQSTLPIGKGMASSSADIVATLRAVAAYYNERLTPSQMAHWAAQIEPSDGIMYPGVVALNPLTGQLLERLGTMPPALIIGVLGHGRINTEDHHRHRIPYGREHQEKLKEALVLARDGIRRRDVARLGQAGRLSARVEYERHPEPHLQAWLRMAEAEEWGLIIGHSGTVRGLILPAPQSMHTVRRIEQRLWAMGAGPVYRLQLGQNLHMSLWGKGGFESNLQNVVPDV